MLQRLGDQDPVKRIAVQCRERRQVRQDPLVDGQGRILMRLALLGQVLLWRLR